MVLKDGYDRLIDDCSNILFFNIYFWISQFMFFLIGGLVWILLQYLPG